jgi:hypothetical protein
MNPILEYVKYLPLDVRLFCIIPYTYEPQYPQLLHDIRTYKVDTRLLDNVYGTMFTDTILLYDLKRFCQMQTVTSFNSWLEVIDEFDLNMLPICFTIWKRHFLYKDMPNSQIYTLLTNFDIMHTSPQRRNMFLWGLLLPNERNMFSNAYILEI